MFGENPLRSAVNDPFNLSVEEIFFTIQGEGPYSGAPALFIRLAGCNLACHFCDTQFETQAEINTPLETIKERIISFPAAQRRLVVLTGGEPLRQNPTALIAFLLDNGTEVVQIETAGTVWPDDDELVQLTVDQKVVLVCSPKTPKVHPRISWLCRHWKYVITAGEQDPSDGLPNRGTQVSTRDKEQRIYRRMAFSGNTIWVSPCDSYNVSANQANLIAARNASLHFGYRLSLQIHKIVGVA